jgi:hypothetical protein
MHSLCFAVLVILLLPGKNLLFLFVLFIEQKMRENVREKGKKRKRKRENGNLKGTK